MHRPKPNQCLKNCQNVSSLYFTETISCLFYIFSSRVIETLAGEQYVPKDYISQASLAPKNHVTMLWPIGCEQRFCAPLLGHAFEGKRLTPLSFLFPQGGNVGYFGKLLVAWGLGCHPGMAEKHHRKACSRPCWAWVPTSQTISVLPPPQHGWSIKGNNI